MSVHVIECECTKYIAHHSGPLSVPKLTVNTFSTDGMYQVERNDTETTRVITGYEVIRFGVPMIGEYVNTGRGRRVTISPAVPGAQYRITAWALDSSRRSATPAVEYVTTREASELCPLLRAHFFKPSFTRNAQSNMMLSAIRNIQKH